RARVAGVELPRPSRRVAGYAEGNREHRSSSTEHEHLAGGDFSPGRHEPGEADFDRKEAEADPTEQARRSSGNDGSDRGLGRRIRGFTRSEDRSSRTETD